LKIPVIGCQCPKIITVVKSHKITARIGIAADKSLSCRSRWSKVARIVYEKNILLVWGEGEGTCIKAVGLKSASNIGLICTDIVISINDERI
jgi:hypothetical protein